jgi:hypothetical protein
MGYKGRFFPGLILHEKDSHNIFIGDVAFS